MLIRKIHNLKHSQGINFIKANQPGVYFLFDKDKKLSYIGESKFPMSRILDHYSRAYDQTNKRAKGIGPVFDYFRIINCKSDDSRIRQHYEKRWIRKFQTRLNYNTKNESYDLNWKEIREKMVSGCHITCKENIKVLYIFKLKKKKRWLYLIWI